MKKNLLLLAGALFITLLSGAQGLKIYPGTSFKALSGISVVIKGGSLTNNGNGNFSNTDLYMTGGQLTQIAGTTPTTFSNLYINKNAATISLKQNIHVTNNVVFLNGLLDLNGYNLLLSPAGLLINENESNHIVGSSGGYVSITVNLNAPSGENPGNLGASITSSHNMGSVVIQRGHQSQTNSGGKSILRYFNIQPANNSSLNAIFRFSYLDAELNGITEANLVMWKSNNGGSSWNKLTTAGKNSTLNYVDVDNLNSFAMFTLSNNTFSTKNVSNAIADNALVSKISSVVLTPNPVLNQAKLTVTLATALNGIMNIFSADGKKLIQQQLPLNSGANDITINVAALAAGNYYLVIEMKDGTRKTISFTKQ